MFLLEHGELPYLPSKQCLCFCCAINQQTLVTERSVGCRIEEMTTPYYYFQRKGYSVDVASIRGGKIPWDELSLTIGQRKIHSVKLFLFDREPLPLWTCGSSPDSCCAAVWT